MGNVFGWFRNRQQADLRRDLVLLLAAAALLLALDLDLRLDLRRLLLRRDALDRIILLLPIIITLLTILTILTILLTILITLTCLRRLTPERLEEEERLEEFYETLHYESSSTYDPIMQRVSYSSPSGQETIIPTTPFIENIQTFECGVEGKTFHLPKHGIAVKIDRETIAEGETVQFEVGVALYGSFRFSDDHYQPISPILWLCTKPKEVTLQKPIKISLPHCLVDLKDEEIDRYGVRFAKADHDATETNPEGKRMFKFRACTEEVQKFNEFSGYISTTHCCYMCIEANKTPEVALRAGYCLSIVEKPKVALHLVHVCAIFYLESCFEALKQQYPEEQGYTTSFYEFKFNEPETAEQDPSVTVSKPSGFTIFMNPGHGQISLSEIDFWKRELSADEMKLRHKLKTYPPRIKLDISKANTSQSLLELRFHGCKSWSGRAITVECNMLAKGTTCNNGTDCGEDELPSPKKPRCDERHVLSPADLRVIRSESFDAHPNWKDVGIELEVPIPTLDGIKQDYEDASDRFREMLIKWLKSVDPKPTWEALIDALMAPTVGQGQLANNLRQRYCPFYIKPVPSKNT